MSKVHRAQDVSGANHAFQYEVLRTTLGTICACLGGLVLAGWQFDVGLLRSIVPGLIAMQPPTAVCFVLLGFAVTRKRKGGLLALSACALALVAAALTALEYVSGRTMIVDTLAFGNAVLLQDALPRHPGRMAEGTAVAFLCLSTAIALRVAVARRVPAAVHVFLAGLPLAIGGISLLGYLLEVRSVRGVLGYTDLALHTAAGLCLLSVATLASRPDAAWLQLLAGPGGSGRLTRRMLPTIVILPPALAWLTLQATKSGMISVDFRLALITLGTVGGLGFLGLEIARHLAAGERRLERQADRLRASEGRLQEIISHAHEAIVTMDETGIVSGWNRQAAATFGWSEAEALGSRLRELIIPERMRAAHDAGMDRFLATREAVVVGKRIELPARRRDGTEFPLEMAISATQTADGWRFTAMMHDISERKAAAELFETTFDNAPIGVALVGLDGTFLKVNAAFAELVGYQHDVLLGMDFQTITHADDLERDLGLLKRLSLGEIADYQMDKRYIQKNGRQVWVNLSVSAVRHENGAPKHYIAQVQDLTARMEAEARYQLMAEHATDTIMVSRDGQATFTAGGCLAMTGWSAEEWSRRTRAEYAHPDDIPLIGELFSRTAAGEVGLRLRWRFRGGEESAWRWLESSPSLMASGGEGDAFVDVIRDVSEQVAQEDALKAARKEAEAATAAKAEFLANMSHEIRTPLTAVIGFSGLLCERQDLSETSRLFADRIAAAGSALLGVVNDVLDFSKLEAGEVQIQPRATDPTEMAREVLSLFQPQADTKGLELSVAVEAQPPALVMIDPQALRQVLFNLIGNAVKFTDSGRVTLRVAHRADRLMVAVADTGQGLTLDQQAKLFQRFSQVDSSSTRRHGGTGLGLAICRGLVEAMGGSIGVTSRPGRGATFHFDIHAPEATASANWGDTAARLRIDGVRVLVADDNANNRDLARAILESLGAEVHEAADGLAAVEVAKSLPFDVILMDVRMPRLDGPAAFGRIRSERGPNRDVPILAFSAAEPGELLQLGFDGVVSKPVSSTSLLDAIRLAVEGPVDSGEVGRAHAN